MQATRSAKSPRKQRKLLYNAPAHLRHKLMAAPLSPELSASKGAKTLPVRKGDTVRIMRGDHKGFEGKISRVDLKNYKIYVEGLTREKVDGTNIFVSVHPSKVLVKNLNLDDKWRKAIVERKKELELPKQEEKVEKAIEKPPKKVKKAGKVARKPMAKAAGAKKEKEAKELKKVVEEKPVAVKEKVAEAKVAVEEKTKEAKPKAKPTKAPKKVKKEPAAKKKKEKKTTEEEKQAEKKEQPKAEKKTRAKRKTTGEKEGGT
jgi:large subunit ribosomal protein L24